MTPSPPHRCCEDRSMYCFVLLIAFAASVAAAAPAAEPARVIDWDDLVPAAAPLENPVENLTQDVKLDLGMVLRGRRDIELGFVEIGSDYHTLLQETE